MKTLHVVVFISIILNILLILFLFGPKQTSSTTKNLSQEQSHYTYLSPRIFVANQNDLLVNFVDLRTKLREYQYNHDSHEDSHGRTGVYFEYLPTGTSIGVNEKETFVPASLLKLPLAMGVYKKIEQGKIDPQKSLTIKPEHIDKGFGTLWEKGAGYELTVKEAVGILLKDSDNTAQHLLYDELSGEEIDNIFDALDIPKERNEEKQAVVTPKNYTSILRCLYLSCYVSKDHSNEILDMLTQTQFNDKLPGTLPKDVKVAHKIGVAVSPNNENTEVFTDCGIIYAKKRPYILCVMTESNEEHARVVMQDISKMVYEYITGTDLP